MGRKRIYIKSLIIFLVVTVVLTFVSSQIYAFLLPEVIVSTQKPSIISKSFDVGAKFTYDKKEEISIPVECKINEIFVKAGDKVKEGTALFSVDKNEMLKSMYGFEIEIEKLKNQRASFANNTSDYKLLNLRIDEMQDKVKIIEDIIEQGYIVKSKLHGVVINIYAEKEKKAALGAEILTIAPKEENMYLKWSMKSEAGEIFSTRDTITADITVAKETADGSLEEIIERVTLPINRIAHDKKENVFLFESNVKSEYEVAMEEGQSIVVKLKYMSSEYKHTVPAAAVNFIGDGKGSVYVIRERKKIFGTEKYVEQVTFDVMEYDNINAAANMAIGFDDNNKVVTYTSKPISDGQAVKVTGR